MIHLSEREVQRAVLSTLARLGYQAFHVENERQLAGDRLTRLKQASRRKADGVRPGVPDLVVIGRTGRVGFIEVKSADGTLSPEQEWWRDMLAERGCPWALVDAPEQTVDVLRDWGWR